MILELAKLFSICVLGLILALIGGSLICLAGSVGVWIVLKITGQDTNV